MADSADSITFMAARRNTELSTYTKNFVHVTLYLLFLWCMQIKNHMIHIRKHSIKVDPPKPKRPGYEHLKNKNVHLNIVSKKFLPTTQIFIVFLTKVLTLNSVSFLLRSPIAPWYNKKRNKSIPRYVTEFLCKIFNWGAGSLPELVPRVEIETWRFIHEQYEITETVRNDQYRWSTTGSNQNYRSQSS